MSAAEFRTGDVAVHGGLAIAQDDIALFGESVGFGGASVAAARWLGVALQLRIMVDEVFRPRASQGAPGLESVEWHSPPQPRDILSVRLEILEVRASRSRPDIDLVRLRIDTLNQRHECLQTVAQWVMFRRGGAVASAAEEVDVGSDPVPARYTPPPGVMPPRRVPGRWNGWDRPAIGMTAALGTHCFEAADVIAFARAFDPQPFHLDEGAARRSIFGRLCASGLHSVVVWAAMADDPRWAVQPGGFRNLRWHRPVFAGDTIHYRSVVRAITRDPRRADLVWLTRLNQGCDSMGVAVIELEDSVAIRC